MDDDRVCERYRLPIKVWIAFLVQDGDYEYPKVEREIIGVGGLSRISRSHVREVQPWRSFGVET